VAKKSLRTLAQGKPCYGRFTGVCNGDPATTVLAHIRRGGIAGVGMKPDDLCALPLCSACHDLADGRARRGAEFTRAGIDADLLRGLVQWLTWLRNNEVITVVL